MAVTMPESFMGARVDSNVHVHFACILRAVYVQFNSCMLGKMWANINAQIGDLLFLTRLHNWGISVGISLS